MLPYYLYILYSIFSWVLLQSQLNNIQLYKHLFGYTALPGDQNNFSNQAKNISTEFPNKI